MAKPPKLSTPSLYLLTFKSEPLIKVGITSDIRSRIKSLGESRFDLGSSYLVHCRNRSSILAAEWMLKSSFNEQKVRSDAELPNGNTETFHSDVLLHMLDAIKRLRHAFPGARFRVERDLSRLASLDAFEFVAPEPETILPDSRRKRIEAHPRPFESVLWPHVSSIEQLLHDYATWAEIVQWLKKEHDITITVGSCCNFWQRYKRRSTFPYKLRRILHKAPSEPVIKSTIQAKRAPLEPLVGAE